MRFDEAVASYAVSSDSVRGVIMRGYKPVIDLMKAIYGVASDSLFMADYSVSLPVTVFVPDIEQRLPSLDSCEQALGGLRDKMAQSMPDINFPKIVYGAVIPFNQSVVISDTIVVIGLNHYLGADYDGYSGFDRYRRKLKIPSRIVPDVAEALIGTAYPYIMSEHQTVLSRILYEGALIHAMMMSCPGLTLEDALGYSVDELRWAVTNESGVWHSLITGELLYSSDPMVAYKLVDPSPATSIINANAPGRIGRYIGYRIISSYIDVHPETKAESMLSPEFYGANTPLIESKYAPI